MKIFISNDCRQNNWMVHVWDQLDKRDQLYQCFKHFVVDPLRNVVLLWSHDQSKNNEMLSCAIYSLIYFNYLRSLISEDLRCDEDLEAHLHEKLLSQEWKYIIKPDCNYLIITFIQSFPLNPHDCLQKLNKLKPYKQKKLYMWIDVFFCLWFCLPVYIEEDLC